MDKVINPRLLNIPNFLLVLFSLALVTLLTHVLATRASLN